MTLDIRLQRRTDRVVWSLAAAFGLFAMHAAFATPPAVAAPPATPAATYRQECGDCHVAYAPRLLPAGDWRRLMAGLDRHFGSDASLDPATTTAILGWLEAGAAPAGSRRDHESRPGRDMPARPPAASGASGGDPAGVPRITTRAWFVHEHDEIDAATWKRPAIGSPANCEACHTDATQGRFSERALRIPR